MSRFVRPYVGAVVIRHKSGIIGNGPNTGKPFAITVHEASTVSTKNGLVRWYTVEAPECKDDRGRGFRQCWRFTERHFDQPIRLFERDSVELEASERRAS